MIGRGSVAGVEVPRWALVLGIIAGIILLLCAVGVMVWFYFSQAQPTISAIEIGNHTLGS
jgi:membrane protein YdbS with pleckstrin-like domain